MVRYEFRTAQNWDGFYTQYVPISPEEEAMRSKMNDYCIGILGKEKREHIAYIFGGTCMGSAIFLCAGLPILAGSVCIIGVFSIGYLLCIEKY